MENTTKPVSPIIGGFFILTGDLYLSIANLSEHSNWVSVSWIDKMCEGKGELVL